MILQEKILFKADDVKFELAELGLDKERLIEAVKFADGEAAQCTANDPDGFRFITLNAKAARGLRDQFCGEDWVRDTNDNQPGIYNSALNIRVIPCNFDENAGDRLSSPKNRNPKGAASKNKTQCNSTAWLPGMAPETPDESGCVTYVLGFYSEDGEPLSAELSLPAKFESKKYKNFSKRIIILDGSEGPESSFTNTVVRDEPTETVDIDIKRK